MTTTVTIRFKFRRGTAAEWATADPVLLAGEPGLESDTGKMKYGDGVTAWSGLAYFSGSITGGQVVAALGYTPYDAANPAGYVTTAGARAALSSGTGINYNSGTGVIGVGATLAAYSGGDTPSAFVLGIVDSADASAFRVAIGAPSTTGANASGTWGISITGNAATATVANALNASSYYAAQRLDLSGDGSNATFNVATPNNGTTGAVRLLGNATSGKAYLQVTNASITVEWGYWEHDSAGLAKWSGKMHVNGSAAPGYGAYGLSVSNGNIANPQHTALNDTTETTIATGAGFVGVVRDTTNGGTALVLYENAQTPVIVAQTGGGTTFQTTAPSGSAQIQLVNKSGNLGVAAKTSTDRNGAVVSFAVLQAD